MFLWNLNGLLTKTLIIDIKEEWEEILIKKIILFFTSLKT